MGNVVVVTGAASGIGLAAVRAMCEPGSVVIGVDLAPAPPELGTAENLVWVSGDVTAEDTWRRVADVAERHDPRGASCMIACAADVVVAPFLRTAQEDWSRLFEINVFGVLRGMRALMPAMIARGAGAIAVVCSVDSLYVEDGLSAYSASKAALLQVVRSAALEHARDGLRINAVCPGAVETALLRRAIDDTPGEAAEVRAAVERRTPTGKILRPEEVAAVLRFLVSDAASGMSGAAVTVDGGLTSTYDYA